MVPVRMLLCKDRVGDGAKTGDHSLVTVLQHCKLLMGEGHWTIKVTTGWLGTLSNWTALAWGQTTYEKQVSFLSLSVQTGGQLGPRAPYLDHMIDGQSREASKGQGGWGGGAKNSQRRLRKP